MDFQTRDDEEYFNELLNSNSDLWNKHRLKELVGCCQATDEELAGILNMPRLSLSNNEQL